jgi:hypothetical protein
MNIRLERTLVRDGENWLATLSSGEGYARTGGVDGNQCTVRFHRDSDPDTVLVWQPYMVGDLATVTEDELRDWLERALRR